MTARRLSACKIRGIDPSEGGDHVESMQCVRKGPGRRATTSATPNRKTRRTFQANVQKVSYVKDGKVVNDYVCARCLKSNKIERV